MLCENILFKLTAPASVLTNWDLRPPRIMSDQIWHHFPDWFGESILLVQRDGKCVTSEWRRNIWREGAEREGTFLGLLIFKIQFSSALSLYNNLSYSSIKCRFNSEHWDILISVVIGHLLSWPHSARHPYKKLFNGSVEVTHSGFQDLESDRKLSIQGWQIGEK